MESDEELTEEEKREALNFKKNIVKLRNRFYQHKAFFKALLNIQTCRRAIKLGTLDQLDILIRFLFEVNKARIGITKQAHKSLSRNYKKIILEQYFANLDSANSLLEDSKVSKRVVLLKFATLYHSLLHYLFVARDHA